MGVKEPRTSCGSAFCKGFLKAWVPGREGKKEGRKEWQELVLRVVRNKIITGLTG